MGMAVGASTILSTRMALRTRQNITRGDPNAPGLLPWKAFNETSQSAMVFGESTGSQQLPSIRGIKAWNALRRCAGSDSLRQFLFESE